MTPPHILLTGGAGFIGSHTYVALCQAGYKPIILDNFCNSHRGVLARLATITQAPVLLEEGDVGNTGFVADVFKRHDIAAVIHFAALKAVGESCANPLLYYRQNVGGLVSLLEAMQKAECTQLVYSSSATVYGFPESLPVKEYAPLRAINPYGHTKIIGEEIIGYTRQASPNLKAAILRYFNPVGAHESGLIGELPQGEPSNLMPYVSQVAAGQRPMVQVFGNDYPTPDGTGIRDYIHVMDLAEGHVAALRHLLSGNSGFIANLGTGHGSSVLEVIKAFEHASGRTIPYIIKDRRAGDAAECYADPAYAEQLLGWKAKRNLAAMCADMWRWQHSNPQGFAE